MRKTILTCAITGAVTSKEQTPYLPITPEEIAVSAIEAAEAGAAIVHIHVRNPETGGWSMDTKLYEQVVNRIKKENSDVLINLTTGPGGTFPMQNLYENSITGMLKSPAQRTEHIIELRPDICSLDFNTQNRGPSKITVNSPNVCRMMLRLVNSVGCKPELEIFDSGDIHLAKQLMSEGLIEGQPFWQFAMGVKYGWSDSAETLDYARRLIPHGSTFSAFGLGAMEMPIVAQSWIYGGHVRVGLEDNIYLEKGVLAQKNSHLVEKAIRIIKDLGGSMATPAEAREILGLNKS